MGAACVPHQESGFLCTGEVPGEILPDGDERGCAARPREPGRATDTQETESGEAPPLAFVRGHCRPGPSEPLSKPDSFHDVATGL